MTWQAYWPDEGETADDAMTLREPIWKRIYDAEDAAKVACAYDFGSRDGWERAVGETFPIVIIDPDGTETRWNCCHEQSVTHSVREAEEE